MKRLFLSLVLLSFCMLSLTACLEESGSNKTAKEGAKGSDTNQIPNAISDVSSYTNIEWIDSVKEVGKVAEGTKVEVVFRFKNTGTKPLIILDAKPSCGCTVPEKPEEPVMSGQVGSIKAVFDSNGRSGVNEKTITVVANTNGTTNHIIKFIVNVEAIKKSDPLVGTTSF